MSYDTTKGLITAPVSVRDVQNALGTSVKDTGSLCVSARIQKWSRHKPVSYPTLTDDDSRFKGADGMFGLEPTIVTGDSQTTNDTNAMAAIIAAIIADGGDWSYIRPSGGESSPYRLHDFKGYCHKVAPPLYMDAADMEVSLASQSSITFRLNFAVDNSYDDHGAYGIAYSELDQFSGSDWYLWMFVSKTSDFSDFPYSVGAYIRSDEAVGEDTTVTQQVTSASAGTEYIVFAFGNASGNKFMTIPNSYAGKPITTYPVKAVLSAAAYDSFVLDYTDLTNFEIGQWDSGEMSSVDACKNAYEESGKYYRLFVGTVDLGLAVSLMEVTMKDDITIAASQCTMKFQGVTHIASALYVDSTATDSCTLKKGSTYRRIDFVFSDVFDKTDSASVYNAQPLDPKIYLKGLVLFDFGSYKYLTWAGADACNNGNAGWYEVES